MAAAHPGVSRSSFTLASPLAFRHRGLTRRKRNMAGPGPGGGGGGGGSSGRRRNSGSSSLWASTGRLDELDCSPEDRPSVEMLTEDGSGGEGQLCMANGFRISRLFTDPADTREAAASADTGTGMIADISSARGVTMDIVHGSVRAKTPLSARAVRASTASATVPVTTATPPSAPGSPSRSGVHTPPGMPSMVDLVEAVDEAAATGGTAVSPTINHLVVEMAEDDPAERTFRATSSAAFFSCLGGELQGPKTKRAKSGVSITDVGTGTGTGAATATAAASCASSGGQLGWMADPNPLPQVSVLSARVEAAGGVASGSESSAPENTNGNGAGGAVAGGEGTVDDQVPAVLTNEAWIALLSPFVQTLPPTTHPEDFLHDILRERGYSTEMVAVKEAAFFRAPEPEQVTGYDKTILRAVLDEDEAALERMRSMGRRMDCCNRFGDSILHMSCRRGRVGTLRYLLRVCPGGVLLSDDFGRTIMHDACWTATPRFDVASAVLDVDTRLLRCLDSRGSSPLQYVPQDQWPLWCAFFESRKEQYWPPLAPGQQDVGGVIQVA